MKEVKLCVLTAEEFQQILDKSIAEALKLYGTTPKRLEEPFDLLTITDVSEIIRYSTSTVRQFIKNGAVNRRGELVRLQTVIISPKNIRVRRADLLSWIDQF